MTFVLVVVHLHLPHARSLKQKRRIVKGLTDRIHHRFRISIAETDFHDLHQRTEIAMALVHRSLSDAERMLGEVRRIFDQELEATVTDWRPELIEGIS